MSYRWNRYGVVPFVSAAALAVSLCTVTGTVYAAPAVTLEQTLKTLRWNPEQQGPLLIIDPAHTKPTSGSTSISATERMPLRLLAGAFSRKIVPLGSLTVLAPTTMVIIGPPLGPPTYAGAMEEVEPLRYLLGTLKPEQWQSITSDGGLPISSLSPQQMVWVDRMIPAAPTIDTPDFSAASRRTLSRTERDQSRLRLSRELMVTLMSKDGAPGSGRNFRGTWLNPGTSAAPMFMMAVSDDKDEDAETKSAEKNHKPILRRVIPSVEKSGDIDLSPVGPNHALLSRPVSLKPDAEGKLTLGTLIKRTSKATGLELYADGRVAALPVWVSTGSRTTARAGDLLRALCQGVTGTLRRVGPPVGNGAYVLTDDQEGIGSRIARIVEWERAASMLADDANNKAQKNIEAANAGKLIKYAPGDPFVLDTALMLDVMRRSDATIYGRGPYAEQSSRGDDLSLSLDKLPASFRRFAEAQAKKSSADTSDPVELRTDRIALDPNLYLALILPDGSTVRAKEVMEGETLNDVLSPEDKIAEPAPDTVNTGDGAAAPLLVSLPNLPKPTILAASAASVEEAKAMVQTARRYGFAQVWLQTPPTQAGLEALAAAVAEGKAKPGESTLPVWGVAPLLKAEDTWAETAGTARTPLSLAQYDQNILGDTSSTLAKRRAAALDSVNIFRREALRFLISKHANFLRFDTPVLAAARMRPFLALAGIPGLAGIALSDTTPPGYGLFPEKSDDWYIALQDSGDFGYTPELRLAFLRQEGCDPIDLSLTGTERFTNGSANLPFFPSPEVPVHTTYIVPQSDGSTRPNLKGLPAERWSAFRRESNERFLKLLYQKLEGAAPRLPLILAERSGGVLHNPAFWGSWDAADKLPYDREITGTDGQSSQKNPHLISRTVYSAMNVPPDDSFASIKDYAAGFPFVVGALIDPDLNHTLRFEGLLIDLRALSGDKTAQFLRLTLKPQEATTK